ncbi:MAG: septal ring lytic transglycosylase RlpA family protein [Azoarcus sp.]|nr:septal ring lytic transglycosylase RlpA family protein [Azoarcus sp.]
MNGARHTPLYWIAAAALAACGGAPSRSPGADGHSPARPALSRPDGAPAAPVRHGGAYYKDDGPGDNPPADLAAIPDAAPRMEALHAFANRPYRVLGQSFVPRVRVEAYRQRGVASWYGRRFHGLPTSSGEPYNMYAMTAAHPTLPIPSYARVRDPASGRAVVVRINDRGPFLHGRVIDLSYAAAWKLGYVDKGHAEVEIEQILPGVPPSAPAFVPEAEATEETETADGKGLPSGQNADPLAELVALAMAENAPEKENAGDEGKSKNESGIFLQLGVFASRENAEELHARAAGLPERFELSSEDGRFRLYAGPYGSSEEAGAAAARICKSLGVRPFTVRRVNP